MRKIGKRLAALLLVTLLSFGLRVSAAAEEFCTVTFYTDANMSTVYATQTVPHKGYAAPPATDPPSYSSGGFRYVFDRWYRHVEGNAVSAFNFAESRIRRDTTLFAGYTQYLAEGYTLVVNYEGGSDFVSDTGTPVSQLLAAYSGIRSVSLVELAHGNNSMEPSASPTPTVTPDASPTPTASEAPTPTATPSETPAPTATPGLSPSEPVPETSTAAAPERESTAAVEAPAPASPQAGDAEQGADTADTRETEAPSEDAGAFQKAPRLVVLLILALLITVGACYLWVKGKEKQK